MEFDVNNPLKWIKKLTEGTHSIKVSVENIPLLKESFKKYGQIYLEKTGKTAVQLITGEDIGNFNAIIYPHKRELIQQNKKNKEIPKNQIDSMGNSLELSVNEFSLSSVRSYVYTNYTGLISVRVENDKILLKRKSKIRQNPLRNFVTECIKNRKLPAVINCQHKQIPYIRNIISEFNDGDLLIKASTTKEGLVIYDLNKIILDATIKLEEDNQFEI